jgi:hypothetical protein
MGDRRPQAAGPKAGKSGFEGSVKATTFITWADWKAATLNRLFQEQGLTGEPGRITAATVRDGERRRDLIPVGSGGQPGELIENDRK